MDRNFTAKLTVKVLDEDERVIEGIASTPRRDRQDDVLEPLGAEYDLPIPFLLDHDHRQNVGAVEMAEATSKGIRFRARIKKIAEPGLAKDLVDQAWHYLKYGLRPMVSVGFQPLDYEPLAGGGYRYKRWFWYELSAVSIGAQPDAVVTGVKRASRRNRAPLRVQTQSSKFVSAAARRKRRGGLITDEHKYVRKARAALAHALGEKNVPRFQTLAALERWDDERQLVAAAKGAVWLGYESLMASAPRKKLTPVVRLWSR